MSMASVGQALLHPPQPIQGISATLSVGTISAFQDSVPEFHIGNPVRGEKNSSGVGDGSFQEYSD